MKLFYSPFHTFVHKVLVTAHECGHWDHLERIATFPFKNNMGEDCGDSYDITPLNPLDKVPTLITDDGQSVFGSQAICEYLDTTSRARKMYPDPGPARWDALRRLSLSDSIFESTVQMVMEQWKPREQWNTGDKLIFNHRASIGAVRRELSRHFRNGNRLFDVAWRQCEVEGLRLSHLQCHRLDAASREARTPGADFINARGDGGVNENSFSIRHR